MSIFDRLTGGSGFERNGSNPADLVLVGGKVLTCESVGSRAEAFAVRDGRFVCVGENAGTAEFIDPDTEVIDARDRVVTPGFIDSHCHILWVGSLEPLLSQQLYLCKSFEQVREAVLEHASAHPDLPFVYCMGWNHDQVPGGVPRKSILGEFIEDRQVLLWSDSAHCGWANSRMTRLMEERNPAKFK